MLAIDSSRPQSIFEWNGIIIIVIIIIKVVEFDLDTSPLSAYTVPGCV